MAEDTGQLVLELSAEIDPGAIKDAFVVASEAALMRVAEALLTDAYAFVPVLTGMLRANGRIEKVPAPDKRDVVDALRVIYDLPYAIVQHEEHYRHPSLGFTGRALYLQKPFELNAQFYVALYQFEMARRLEDQLGS